MEFSFQDGVLHLRTPQGELQLQWDPSPVARERLARGRWEPFIPEFRILSPQTRAVPAATPSEIAPSELARTKQSAFQAFRSALPAAVADAVEPFTSHQWVLLTLAHDSPAGADLLHANPVLAYALANNAFLQQRPSAANRHQAARYSHHRQREIAGWLGFPETEAMVRIFHKISPGLIHPAVFRKLREAARNAEALKVFSHLPRLNTGVIYLISYRELALLASPRLIQEVAGSDEEAHSAPTADTLLELFTLSKAMGRHRELRPFTSRRRIQEAHERVIREHREREAAAAANEERNRALLRAPAHAKRGASKDVPFPPPPIPGTETIIPLTSFRMLQEESRLRRNCVGISCTYADQVVLGRYYLYRVLAGGSGYTLGLCRRAEGIWSIAEFKGYGNTRVPEEVRSAVSAWLYEHQASV